MYAFCTMLLGQRMFLPCGFPWVVISIKESTQFHGKHPIKYHGLGKALGCPIEQEQQGSYQLKMKYPCIRGHDMSFLYAPVPRVTWASQVLFPERAVTFPDSSHMSRGIPTSIILINIHHRIVSHNGPLPFFGLLRMFSSKKAKKKCVLRVLELFLSNGSFLKILLFF